MIFKCAMIQHLINEDPSDDAFIPHGRKTVAELENEKIIEDMYLEKKELDEFLQAVKLHGKPEDYTIFFILAWTGVRLGELIALKWRDINFEEKTISITKTYYCPSGVTKDFTLLTPKTVASIRTIEIDDDKDSVVSVLKVHRLNQNKIKLFVGKEYFDEGFVFGRPYPPYFGYPMDLHTVESRMDSLLTKHTTIKNHVTPHGLRHTHTSLLDEAGVDLERIMDRLGHVDDDTTKKVYLHVTKPRKKGASLMFGEHMRNANF
ncbi:site-specific integrase [Sporolactobacillus shoreicorticis]|uniref:Site-specific integrase n=1 Tax=Sporolactobacillus shoreicorticis TaxID=1923877 RepID=A0ABW5RZB5_9BACL|nr:site-specific integrase [Sporolactobacillus shoreicorticis]MCO7128017.1 site-specific integrase [Sporolactobacillus shoreicorticis]